MIQADGYGRSEAVVSILLQRKCEANRIYATVLNTRTNTDGYKPEGITYPSIDSQCRLMTSTMKETGIDPLSIKYIEAHMTGTPAGDVVESESIRRSFCEGRSEPLLLGCLKSNLGHTEGASGCCALSKVCLAFENQELPPNLNFDQPNPNIDGLRIGILKPVTQRMPFHENIVGVSSFGFGGCNVYTVLKANDILPTDDSFTSAFNYKVPRLVLFSGRTKDSVNFGFNYIDENKNKVTNDFFALLNRTMKNDIRSGMIYRGYSLYNLTGDDKKVSIKRCKIDPQPIWLAISGICTKWLSLPQEILKLQPVNSSLNAACKFAESLGVNLTSVLYAKKDINLAQGMVGIAAIQIALIDLLRSLDVKVDGIIGHSIGEIVCGYADGGLNQQQALSIAYHVAKELMSITVKNGQTGLEWDEIGVHTDKIKSIFNGIRNSLDKNVFNGKSFNRSASWVPSFSLGEGRVLDNTKLSAEYFAHAFTSKINFREMLCTLPKNAAAIEIAPQPMLESALRKGLGPDASIIQLLNLKESDQPALQQVLHKLGTIYLTGNNLAIEALYPPVNLPVPRGTLPLSPMIQWDHSKSCTVTKYPEYFKVIRGNASYDIDLMQSAFQYLGGHIIDGRNLCPAVEYLRSCWQAMVANLHGSRNFMDYTVEFRKVKFSRGIMLSTHKPVELTIRYQRDTGAFETLESGNLCCSGYAYLCDDQSTDNYESMVRKTGEVDSVTLDAKSIYKELRVRGYDYGPSFQGIVEASSDGCHGRVKWMGQWVSFVDSMLQIAIVGSKARELRIPTYIEYVKCNAKAFLNNVESNRDEMGESVVDVYFDKEIGVGISKGMVLMGLKTSAIPRRTTQTPVIESYSFSPFIETKVNLSNDNEQKLSNYLQQCQQLSQLIKCHPNLDECQQKQLEEIRSNISDSPKCSLLATLNETLSALMESETSSPEQVPCAKSVLEEKMAQFKNKYAADLLVSSGLECERVTRHQVDLVLENLVGKDIRVLEMNRTSHLLSENLAELLDANLIHSDYTVLHSVSSDQLLSRSANTLIDWTKHIEKDSSSIIPTDLTELDLIIYKDDSTGLFVTALSDVQSVLEASISRLKVGGFILLFYRSDISPLEDQISQMANMAISGHLRSTEALIEYAKELNLSFVSSKVQRETKMCSLLLRKPIDPEQLQEIKVLPVDTFAYNWIEDVKHFLLGESVKGAASPDGKEKEESKEEVTKRRERAKKIRLWLTSNDKSSGIIGLLKCLRKEPGCESVRCLFDATSSNKITEIPDEILRCDLVINHRDSSTKLLGSMRHSSMQISEKRAESNHAYVDIKTKGDMSSFRWLENSTKYFPSIPPECRMSKNETLVQIHYAALNFKDVMIASGRISTEAYPSGMGVTGGMLGMEFSGTDENGNQVMGYTIGKGMATEVSVLDPLFLWPVPKSWTLEEAATVPVVYATVYYSLFIRGKLKPGESILIHSGAGGVGQAAINICQALGCKIFTTCSDSKRDFLKQKFNLKDNQIANSRDTTFEELILRQTNGYGVDMILNSLSEAKLKASINCLAEYGRFIEIGKYDILVNSALDMSRFGRNQAFETVCLAHLDFDAFIHQRQSSVQARKLVYEMLCKGLKEGVVKPLDRKVFDKDEVEDAFRFMASGKHTGKVLVRVRNDELANSEESLIKGVIQQTLFNPNRCYIIAGGLGGFGLELTHWLVTRGAKKIILTSRTGIKENYQSIFLERIQEISFGCQILISTEDITSEQGVLNILSLASSIAPVGGIFNLAMVLTDAALENQNEESFDKCCKPKVHATDLLDKLSRIHCPKLEYFVCFSSIVSGRGNPGQTNYGFANSFMEQICQNRLANGLPGLAIQWGAIGDVGVVAELLGGNDVVIGGTSVPQRIHSCLETLDQLMAMSNEGCAVASSMVKVNTNRNSMGVGKGDLLGTVCHILGIKDPSTLDPNCTLGELGMDSLMAIEIKQGLEREFDIVLSTQEIRQMSVKQLKQMQAEIAAKGGSKGNGEKGKGSMAVVESTKVTFEEILHLPKGNLCRLNNCQAGKPIIVFGPMEGSFRSLISVAKYVNRPMIGMNWTEDAAKIASLKDVAAYYVHLIKQNFQDNQYDLMGFDFGGLVSLEVAAQLQLQFGDHACNKVGLIESSPDLMKLYALDLMQQAKNHPHQEIDPLYNSILVEYVKAFFEVEMNEENELLASLGELKDNRELKLAFISNVFNSKVERGDQSDDSSSPQEIACDASSLAPAIERFFKKIQLCSQFQQLSKPKMPITIGLQKAAESGMTVASKLDHAYNLSKYQTPGQELGVSVLQGDHRTVVSVDAEAMGNAIDSFFVSIACA